MISVESPTQNRATDADSTQKRENSKETLMKIAKSTLFFGRVVDASAPVLAWNTKVRNRCNRCNRCDIYCGLPTFNFLKKMYPSYKNIL